MRRPGEIVDRDGHVLGRHEGQHDFTVGQRRGLGVAGSEAVYVLEKDAAHNRVVVGPREALAATRVVLEGARLHRDAASVESVRLRYHAEPIACRVEQEDGRVELELERPARGCARDSSPA